MPSMGYPLLKHKLHQLLRRWRHILKTLPKGNNGEAHALQVLDHLDGAPAVESDLSDVVLLSEALDEFLYEAVMDHVALRGLQGALLLPEVIRDMIAPDSELHVLFRYPEVWEDHIFVLFIQRWEHQHE